MPSLGDAYVDVRANTAQFDRDLKQGVTQSTQAATAEMGKLGKATEKVGALAKIAIAGLAIGALAKVGQFAQDSIRAYSDLNESINAVNVTFGASAQEVQALGASAARNLGLSNAEFNSLAVSVSAFTEKIAQGLGADVPGTLDDLTTRIADFASVMNLDVADAFEKFRSGLAGESEPLRKYGIDVSAATVEQVALAEGIIETGETMTESEKVTARYLAIMEQTEKVAGDFANTSTDLANAQRIAAAEMENAKARAGEALVPFAQLTTKLQLLGAETLGIVATGFNTLFGNMTKAQGAVQSFEILTGATANTLEALVTVNKDTGVSFEELAATMNLTADASEPLTEGQKSYLEQIGYTAEEIAELDVLLAGEHVEALAAQEAAAKKSEEEMTLLESETLAAADATEKLNVEIQINSDLIRAAFDAQRARTDATFGLRQATEDQAVAQKAVNDAISEFGDGSPEHLAALEGLAGANLDLRDAEIQVREEGAFTRDEFVNQQTELGLTRQQAELLADQYDHLFIPRTVDHTIRFNEVVGSQYSSSIGGRQHGGPVAGGTPYLVGEAGPEIFVPRIPGTIIPNNNITTGGIKATVNVTVGAGVSRADGMMVGVEVERALRRLAESRTVA